MVESSTWPDQDLDEILFALSDKTRRSFLRRLAGGGELTVGELAEPTALSLAAVSKHLKILERAGLLHREKAGSYQVCRLRADLLRNLKSWFNREF